MGYKVLAQQYRPQVFDDVIGQEIVTRTLKNSIKQGRIANAYMFCGPRGVGKTTVARLLSKTINCEGSPEKAPCNKCASCKEITRGGNIDVMEIDGASNNRVDEIRVLLENVQFSPSKGKYKIYIIDEVHMLSPGAFNALLKTLEEPPEHVKFIFATTEQHKVLPTIMSRCQRFDFKRITPGEILKRLKDISGKEKILLDEKAALLIARAADGSLRDALVILDQMISFSADKILPGDVVELLGTVDKKAVFELTDHIIENDPAAVIKLLDKMIDSGKDPVFIANILIDHFRDIMVLKNTKEPTSDMVFSEDEIERIGGQVDRLSKEEVLYILQNLTHLLLLMKSAMFPRAPLEVALVRLTKRGEILSLPDIIEGLKKKGMRTPDTAGPSEKTDISSGRTDEDKPRTGHSADKSVPAGVKDKEDNISVGFNWNAVLKYVKSKKVSVYTFLCPAKPVEITNKKAVIGFGKEHAFNKEVLEAGSNLDIVEEAVTRISGKNLKVEFSVLEFLGESSKAPEEKKKAAEESRSKMKPAIEKAMDVFGGHLVRDYTEGV